MLFRMLRTQTSEHGTLRMGVAYDTDKAPGIVKLAKALIEKEFAEEVTAKQLDQEKVKAEKPAEAQVTPAKSGKDSAALKAAKAAEADAKKEAEAAKAAEADAQKQAEDAKAEAEALAARVAELEALVADKEAGQAET